MKVVYKTNDTVRFENLSSGDGFYLDSILCMKVTGPTSFAAVEVFSGNLRTVASDTQVSPARCQVVVEDVGRTACGFNPR